jgi:hypothetical protein
VTNLPATLNLIATLAAVAAVVSSTFLAAQALRYSRNANHMPVIIELFKEHRSADFVKKEQFIWREMPRQNPAKGFEGLPKKTKSYATDVALFYLMISYLSEYKICDQELVALQVKYRLLRTWKAIELHVRQERLLRGGEYTFLNTLEVFVERVRALDSDAIAERMFSRIR